MAHGLFSAFSRLDEFCLLHPVSLPSASSFKVKASLLCVGLLRWRPAAVAAILGTAYSSEVVVSDNRPLVDSGHMALEVGIQGTWVGARRL